MPKLPILSHRLVRFAELSIRKAWADHLLQRSAALGFVTVLAIVPLLTVFSLIGKKLFDQDPERLVEILSRVMPFAEETLVQHLGAFLHQASTLSGPGFVALLLTSLGVFSTVEETFNRIWNVSRRRDLRSRLLSFILVLFLGPLVGATYSSLFVLRNRSGLSKLADSIPLQVVPLLVTLIVLSMLYWLVPYTKVRLPHALWGALVATFLIEVLRRGFGLYVSQLQFYSVIYGTFGLALLFMISIQLSWWIVLLGSEVTYCLQHHPQAAHRQRQAALEGSWVALAALALVLKRFRDRQPITPQELLAERLRLDADELQQALEPLLELQILRRTSGEDAGYLLSCDPYRIDLTQVLEAYEGEHQALLEPLPAELISTLGELRQRLIEARRRGLAGLTLAGLLLGKEVTEPPSTSAPGDSATPQDPA